MADLESGELIKLEEDTSCSLPFDPQYRISRMELTRLATLRGAGGLSHPDSVPDKDHAVRVLVVESEPIVALLLRLVLENRGYSVRVAETRPEAVTQSRIWAPDVVVAELPCSAAASAEFVAQVRAQVDTQMGIVGTCRDMLQIAGIDALFTRPVEAEQVAKGVGSLLGENTDEPT